ncbi:hypothetical protein GPX89_42820 [Nocardia sp. ET3-3]|uniref:Uncharacterized protein n=1 Tax=Nocardia terrae TaxID=2675851 RepID=A0A7K1VBC6_9NOCA|nr:hypothetical protein [Nocardia terrae]MVU83950.1 hypothetical protein [Nocardia terrae]
MTINPIRTALATAAVGASLLAAPALASAAPLDSPATPIGTTGSADSGSAGPGSIICWLLHPSPTCQV